MRNEDEKLREAAKILSVNCEGYRDECKGCLFCRDNLSCKIDGIPMWWPALAKRSAIVWLRSAKRSTR